MRLPDTLRTHDEIIFCVISNGFYLCLHFLGSSVPEIPDPEEDDNGDTAIFKKTTFDKNKYTCTLQILEIQNQLTVFQQMGLSLGIKLDGSQQVNSPLNMMFSNLMGGLTGNKSRWCLYCFLKKVLKWLRPLMIRFQK